MILDDENILMNKANNNITAEAIYYKIINREQLTKTDIDWINNKVGVYEVNKDELFILTNIINKEKRYYKLSLNWLDVSHIKDMSYMFNYGHFNGDISKWDVSNVENMNGIFRGSAFNNDISKWDVSNVEDMRSMFYNSQFNGDISKWNVSKVKNMPLMFKYSKFNRDISKWDVRNVIDMGGMFYLSNFNGDISKWEISSKCDTYNIFAGCFIKDKYKPKIIK